jgi:hypothetical protein
MQICTALLEESKKRADRRHMEVASFGAKKSQNVIDGHEA